MRHQEGLSPLSVELLGFSLGSLERTSGPGGHDLGHRDSHLDPRHPGAYCPAGPGSASVLVKPSPRRDREI